MDKVGNNILQIHPFFPERFKQNIKFEIDRSQKFIHCKNSIIQKFKHLYCSVDISLLVRFLCILFQICKPPIHRAIDNEVTNIVFVLYQPFCHNKFVRHSYYVEYQFSGPSYISLIKLAINYFEPCCFQNECAVMRILTGSWLIAAMPKGYRKQNLFSLFLNMIAWILITGFGEVVHCDLPS